MNNTYGYAKGSHYQRTKFLICYCLNYLRNDNAATCQELKADICLLSIGSIRACCSRMTTCYIRPGKRYKRPYLRKLSYRRPVLYKLRFKGLKFLRKILTYHRGDYDKWVDELITARKERDEVQKFMREHYKKLDPKSINKQISNEEDE